MCFSMGSAYFENASNWVPNNDDGNTDNRLNHASGIVSAEADLPSGMLLPIDQRDGDWTSHKPGSLTAYRERYRMWLSGESKDNVSIPVRRTHYRTPDTIGFDAPLALFELWRDEDERLRYHARDLRQPAAMVRHSMIEW